MRNIMKGFDWGRFLREEKLQYWGQEAIVTVYESIAAELVRVILFLWYLLLIGALGESAQSF